MQNNIGFGRWRPFYWLGTVVTTAMAQEGIPEAASSGIQAPAAASSAGLGALGEESADLTVFWPPSIRQLWVDAGAA